MRSSWLYLATRSPRAGAPVLIWPALVATARSAMNVSSGLAGAIVADHAGESGARCARLTASKVSLTVPIWFTLTSRALAD